MLIDVSVHDDKNIALKEAEKVSKYTDLEIEINRMWNMTTKVVGALGTMKKDFAKGVELISGRPKVSEIQKSPCWALPTFYEKCLDESLRGIMKIIDNFIIMTIIPTWLSLKII